MVWTRTKQETARVANQDLRGTVYFGAGQLRTVVDIVIDGYTGETDVISIDELLADSSLTTGEQNTFKQLWAKIRDDALALAGFTQT